MDNESEVLRELRGLREEVSHLRHLRRRQPRLGMRPPSNVFGRVLHAMAYDPKTQYHIHLYAALFWVGNAVAVTIALIVFPDQWAAIAVFYVAIVSLYANFATDYGAMSAAEAAMHEGALPELPTEPITRAFPEETKPQHANPDI